MPWTPKEATSHTKKASSPRRKKVWAEVANEVLSSGKSEGSAIRIANSVIRGGYRNPRHSHPFSKDPENGRCLICGQGKGIHNIQ